MASIEQKILRALADGALTTTEISGEVGCHVAQLSEVLAAMASPAVLTATVIGTKGRPRTVWSLAAAATDSCGGETVGQEATQTFDQWAIVELMGHVRLAGRVTEEEHFGAKLGRIDIPAHGGGFTTQLFGGGSVYRLTPTTEEVARAVALRNQPEPVHRWELPARAESEEAARALLLDDEDDDDDDVPL